MKALKDMTTEELRAALAAKRQESGSAAKDIGADIGGGLLEGVGSMAGQLYDVATGGLPRAAHSAKSKEDLEKSLEDRPPEKFGRTLTEAISKATGTRLGPGTEDTPIGKTVGPYARIGARAAPEVLAGGIGSGVRPTLKNMATIGGGLAAGGIAHELGVPEPIPELLGISPVLRGGEHGMWHRTPRKLGKNVMGPWEPSYKYEPKGGMVGSPPRSSKDLSPEEILGHGNYDEPY